MKWRNRFDRLRENWHGRRTWRSINVKWKGELRGICAVWAVSNGDQRYLIVGFVIGGTRLDTEKLTSVSRCKVLLAVIARGIMDYRCFITVLLAFAIAEVVANNANANNENKTTTAQTSKTELPSLCSVCNCEGNFVSNKFEIITINYAIEDQVTASRNVTNNNKFPRALYKL